MDTTILIVDDEPELLGLIADIFRRKKFNVLTADNGKSAFEIVCNQTVNIILSDVRMPGGSGIDLLNEVKNRNVENPPIVLMTGYTDITNIDAYALGLEALLAKPFERNELIGAINKLLIKKEKRWEAAQNSETESIISIKFDSIEHAIKAKKLSLGRGGLFTGVLEGATKPGAQVALDIRFASGAISSITGTGIVRWTRAEANADGSSGCGVEFLFLEESCRSLLVNFIDDQIKAGAGLSFIPKC